MASPIKPAASPVHAAPARGTILIVDDTPANLGVIEESLTRRGLRVLIAQDGEEALERAALAQPNLILLDVLMPGMDGFAVCLRLRAMPATCDIPVIFMTALTEVEHRLAGFAAGGVDYITKPVQIEEMIARVDMQLRCRALQQELEASNLQLRRHLAGLEQRVAERTFELSESNRRLSEEIAERKPIEERLALKKFALDKVGEAVYLTAADGRLVYVNDECCRASGYSRQELLAMHADQIECAGAPLAARWGRVRAQGSSIEQARHRGKDGRSFPVELSCNYFEYKGAAYCLTLARDVTERKAAEAALRESEWKFRTLAENAPDMIVRYDRACRRVYVNPACEKATGFVADGLAHAEADRRWRSDMPVQRYGDLLRQVMDTETAIERMQTWTEASGRVAHFICHLVPEYDMDERVRGVLTIWRNVSALKQAETRLEESRLQLRALAARRDQAREDERKHIARELHDELGQTLTALRMNVSLLRVRFGAHNPALMDHARSMTELVDRNIQVVRNVASSLRPAALDMGAASALEWLVEQFMRHTGVACALRVAPQAGALEDDCAMVVFRVVQESLTNIARHANASEVQVSLQCEAGAYLLEVRDDGCGFEPQRTRQKTLGLVGMRERVLMLGGELSIVSTPACGTAVSVRIPLAARGPV